MAEAEFTEEEIDFTMEMIRDLIPYDTPNYMQKVREMILILFHYVKNMIEC